MARRGSLVDWTCHTREELTSLVGRVSRWKWKFGREVVSHEFAGCAWGPLNDSCSCLQPILDSLQLMLEQVHVGDATRPLQLYVNRYRDGGVVCRPHCHGCRQLTLSVGVERTLTVQGAGLPPGEHAIRMRCGDFVLLDGQQHGVPADKATAVRYSLNLFYCTAHDWETARGGRGAVNVTAPPHVCRRCGFPNRSGHRCLALDAGWNPSLTE